MPFNIKNFIKKKIIKSMYYDKDIQLNFPPKIDDFDFIFHNNADQPDADKATLLVYSNKLSNIFIEVHKAIGYDKITAMDLLSEFNNKLFFYENEQPFNTKFNENKPSYTKLHEKIKKYCSANIEFLSSTYKMIGKNNQGFSSIYLTSINKKFIIIRSNSITNNFDEHERNVDNFITQLVLKSNHSNYIKGLTLNKAYLYKIIDPSLEKCLEIGKIKAQDKYKEYRRVLMHVPEFVGSFYYPYRVLFYYQDSNFPILALNMENSAIGTLAFGAHTISSHILAEMKEESEFTFENFIQWVDSATDELLIETEKEMK